jgi:hypothetical protein
MNVEVDLCSLDHSPRIVRNQIMAKTATKNAPAKPAKQSKKPAAAPVVVEQTETRNQQGHRIQAAMTKTLLTVEQIAERVGLSATRVTEHVNWEISKGRSKFNGKKQVVVISQPKYRQG